MSYNIVSKVKNSKERKQMVRYNWKKLLRGNNRSSRKIIDTIYYLTYAPRLVDPSSIYYRISQQDWRGQSFLRNAESLLDNRARHSDKDIANYIGLASLRSFGDYTVTGDLTLSFLICSGKEALIQTNSLLELDGEVVHFLYEEVNKPKEKHHGISIQ